MKLILDIWVRNTAAVAHHGIMRKELQTNIVPPPGVYYSDVQWGDKPKIPTSITLDVEQNYCHLQFEDDDYPSEEEYDFAMAAYRNNGWKRAGEYPL